MKKQKVFIQIIIILGIVLVLNLISNKAYFRLDFTADKRYTLSEATLDVLEGLDDVVTIKAYFTDGLPTQYQNIRQDFLDQLIEYENRSGGNIYFDFINPNESEELEQEAQQEGIAPLMVNLQERDQVKQMRAYLGATVEIGEEKEVIPFIRPDVGMEYDLTTAIKRIAVSDKPKVAFIQGHGEPTINASAQVVKQLSVLYDVEPYMITDTANIPTYYKALALINPKDTIPANHFTKLDKYLGSGGGLFIAYSNMNDQLNTQYFNTNPDIGLKKWLEEKEVILKDQFIVDANCGSVQVPQRLGPIMVNAQVEFPFLPILSNFSKHPITKGLEAVIMPFAYPITYRGDSSQVEFEVLARSSKQSGTLNPPVLLDINKEWTESDFTEPEQNIAIALSGPIEGTVSSKMVIVANGSFAVNGEATQPGQPPQQVNEDNANFASNAIDWLSDDTGLIELRTKGITSRPLDPVEDSTKTMIKYANVFAPIFLILGVGFYRRHRNNRKRQNWIEGNY
ncbi:MAG: GldG family protein [Flammeovirgaceae bacterium]|nr:GldG family protein [Flammeovirgaceae bacterium]